MRWRMDVPRRSTWDRAAGGCRNRPFGRAALAYGVHMDSGGGMARSASSAESLARPTTGSAGEAAQLISNLASVAEFTDATGVVWRRRGTAYVDEKRLRRLLLDPAVRVLHDYLGEVTEVPSGEREAFWASARRSMARDPNSDFVGSEYKNAVFEHLLVIHENC